VGQLANEEFLSCGPLVQKLGAGLLYESSLLPPEGPRNYNCYGHKESLLCEDIN
jgi:hypothetical protein